MNVKLPVALLLTLLLAPQIAWAAPLRVLPGSSASFVVHARRMFTHETIVGVNTAVSGTVQVPASAGGRVEAHIVIDAAGFRTGNDLRDEHVREALQAKTAPQITFDLSGLPGFDPWDAAASVTLTAEGRFSVAGHSHDLRMPLVLSRVGQGWRVQGAAMAGFKALQVTPPGIPLVVSVQDALELKVDLRIGG